MLRCVTLWCWVHGLSRQVGTLLSQDRARVCVCVLCACVHVRACVCVCVCTCVDVEDVVLV